MLEVFVTWEGRARGEDGNDSEEQTGRRSRRYFIVCFLIISVISRGYSPSFRQGLHLLLKSPDPGLDARKIISPGLNCWEVVAVHNWQRPVCSWTSHGIKMLQHCAGSGLLGCNVAYSGFAFFLCFSLLSCLLLKGILNWLFCFKY